MLTVGKEGSVIENIQKLLKDFMESAKPEYYPPVENLLDLIYEHYTENNSVAPRSTKTGRDAKRSRCFCDRSLPGDGLFSVLFPVPVKAILSVEK